MYLLAFLQGERYEIPVERLEAAVEEIINPEAKEGTGMFQVNYNKLCDLEQAKREAQQLNDAGEKRWGTDEETFNRIFSTRDYYQLRATWNEYVKVGFSDNLFIEPWLILDKVGSVSCLVVVFLSKLRKTRIFILKKKKFHLNIIVFSVFYYRR